MDAADEQRHPGPALRIAADYAWRLLVVGVVIYFAVRLLEHVSLAVVPLLVGLLVTALLRPVVVWLRARGIPRGLATVLTALVAGLTLGGLITLVVVRAIAEAPQLGAQINRVIPNVRSWLLHGPIHLNPATVDSISKTITNDITRNTSALASTALSTGRVIADLLGGSVLALIITIFLLYDGEKIWAFFVHLVPREGRRRAEAAGNAAWVTLSHYVRGTLLVAGFHGTVIAVTLMALGVPLVAPLAVLVGLGSFVPLIGAVVTGVVAVAVAGVEQGLVAAVVVAVMLLVDNQIEAHILQPLVIGRYVRIHPLATVLALAAGALLFGIVGAIVAVPVAACLNAGARALAAGSSSEPQPPKAAAGKDRASPARAGPAGAVRLAGWRRRSG